MKFITFIINSLPGGKTYSTLFSEALAEAVKDMSKEMGWHVKEQDKVRCSTGIKVTLKIINGYAMLTVFLR